MGQTSPRRDPARADDVAPVLTVVRGTESGPRPVARTLRFGDFELATESGELRRDGEIVKLQPQPARLLQYLAERSGRAISRRELQAHLWGENRFVDSEQGLNYGIKSIRRALGDRADHPTYLETIPRRGYRFCAGVEVVDDSSPRQVSPAVSPSPPAKPDLRTRRLGLALTAIAAITLFAGLLWLALAGREEPPRIAVLPFENHSSRPADAQLVGGLTAELISRLVRAHGKELGVIAQTSTMAYADRRASVAEIGAELDVDLLLTGSVQRAGETLRLSAQLIDVAGETVRWAEVTERRASDGLEDWTTTVSSAVASELGLQPATQALPAFELPAELYEFYPQGISRANLETAEGMQQALETLAEVRRRAPDFAPAHLAWARLRVRSGSVKELLPEVMSALEQAITLDPDFAEAHLEITRLRGLYLYEWRRGAKHVQRALELRPRLADAHIVHAMYLAAAGRVDEAIAAMHRALVIDPLSQSTSAHMAWSYFFDRQYGRAIEVSRRTLEIDPESVSAHFTIIHSLIELGDDEGALAQGREMTGQGHDDLEAFWRFHIEQGRASSGVVAIWLVQLGDRETALDRLMQACHEQVGWPLPFLRVDPRFDALRRHPRFADVLECTGLT